MYFFSEYVWFPWERGSVSQQQHIAHSCQYYSLSIYIPAHYDSHSLRDDSQYRFLLITHPVAGRHSAYHPDPMPCALYSSVVYAQHVEILRSHITHSTPSTQSITIVWALRAENHSTVHNAHVLSMEHVSCLEHHTDWSITTVSRTVDEDSTWEKVGPSDGNGRRGKRKAMTTSKANVAASKTKAPGQGNRFQPLCDQVRISVDIFCMNFVDSLMHCVERIECMHSRKRRRWPRPSWKEFEE